MARRRQHRAPLHHMLPDPARRIQPRLILTPHTGRTQTTPKKTSPRRLPALAFLRRTRFDPVTLPLKGVGRQCHPPQLPPTPHAPPVLRPRTAPAKRRRTAVPPAAASAHSTRPPSPPSRCAQTPLPPRTQC